MLARSGATALEAGPLPAPLGEPVRCALLPLPLVLILYFLFFR